MTTPRLSQTASIFAWVALAIVSVATPTAKAYAQGYAVATGSYFFDESYGSYQIEETTYLDIDDNLNLDAYARTYSDGFWDDFWDDVSVETDLYIYDNGGLVAWGLGDDYAEESMLAFPDSTYEADGIAYACTPEYYGDGYYNGAWGNCDELGDIVLTVDTDGLPPNIDSNDPSSGTAGDSGTMYIYGENLTNSDGSAPSVSFWSDTSNNYSDEVQFNNVQVVDPEDITAQYSIQSGTQSDLGSVVVQTDGGTAYGPDFNISAATTTPATISSLDPPSWTANGQTFTLTIYGSGFGSSPSVSISDQNGCVQAGSAYNSDPNGTYTSVDVTISASCAANDTATVTLTANGSGACTGSCFSGTNQGSSPSGTASFQASIFNGNACPDAIIYNDSGSIKVPNVDQWVPAHLTGVGLFAAMQVVSTSGAPLNGSQITETVTPVQGSSTCTSPNLAPANICQSNGTLMVNSRGDPSWAAFAPQTQYAVTNQFWDAHITIDASSPQSFLAAGSPQCFVVCKQSYSCNNGAPIATFTITRTFSTSIVNGTPVTEVKVTKK